MATALTRDGREWIPAFLESIDHQACIGCGRCYKVCGRGVMAPIDKPYDEDEDEDEMCGGTVMSVGDAGACIGCQACGTVCAKKAHSYAAA
jgi:Nif-specific ferredoxin III